MVLGRYHLVSGSEAANSLRALVLPGEIQNPLAGIGLKVSLLGLAVVLDLESVASDGGTSLNDHVLIIALGARSSFGDRRAEDSGDNGGGDGNELHGDRERCLAEKMRMKSDLVGLVG